MANYRLRKSNVQAWQVEASHSNQDRLAEFVHGQVRGTKLPLTDRVVQWYNPYLEGGMEIEAKVGDWIVRYIGEYPEIVIFVAYPDNVFRSLFREEGETR